MSIDPNRDPIEQFKAWLAEAERSEPNDPNAMALATATPDGIPSARMVLLKGVDADGFAFYTNLGSRKADELAANPRAALCFHWKSLRRQVRVQGRVTPVDDRGGRRLFRDPRQGQPDRRLGVEAIAAVDRPFRTGGSRRQVHGEIRLGAVPRPPHWSGYRVIPDSIEFWEDRPFRLHMRFLFRRTPDGWTAQEIFP